MLKLLVLYGPHLYGAPAAAGSDVLGHPTQQRRRWQSSPPPPPQLESGVPIEPPSAICQSITSRSDRKVLFHSCTPLAELEIVLQGFVCSPGPNSIDRHPERRPGCGRSETAIGEDGGSQPPWRAMAPITAPSWHSPIWRCLRSVALQLSYWTCFDSDLAPASPGGPPAASPR